MSEFASCYFCGTALDAQIDPYPVVPEDAGTDERPTVDLCPVCRRKLSKVLDVALSAADGAERTATPLAAGPEPSPLSADHEDPTADLGSDDDEGPAYAVEPTGEATAVADGEDEREGEAEDAVPNGSEPGTVADEGEPDASEGSETVESESGEAETSPDDEAEMATDAETAEETDRDESDGSEGTDQPSLLSTPAAQKVIKLLQNREFPVEREEIEVVASNAYAIPQQDCEDVLDALVSEGYVGEQKGKLVRSEE
ncbi:hypothetical protein BV210_13395 [Halorientalis sp. IM1011]|uniref:hypothetical protein n=1 Tax=Halorientalis sp. IM1011 TaxID=1932360 RepID=UPI00097CC2DE|nr:hypothetical protein [Halorientalis sp. IM1011]AQL43632.1 hypothetical protein BV210_13395 [Halorientalis sp. IM1011]